MREVAFLTLVASLSFCSIPGLAQELTGDTDLTEAQRAPIWSSTFYNPTPCNRWEVAQFEVGKLGWGWEPFGTTTTFKGVNVPAGGGIPQVVGQTTRVIARRCIDYPSVVRAQTLDKQLRRVVDPSRAAELELKQQKLKEKRKNVDARLRVIQLESAPAENRDAPKTLDLSDPKSYEHMVQWMGGRVILTRADGSTEVGRLEALKGARAKISRKGEGLWLLLTDFESATTTTD